MSSKSSQEYESFDMNGPSKTFVAYISIDDEKSKDNKWSTFYSPKALKDWYEKHRN